MRPIPLGCVPQPLLERDGRPPAELSRDLRMVQQVAAIVAGSIVDVGLETPRFVEDTEDRVGELLDAPLVATADVVGLARPATLQDQLDGCAMVIDVQPLATVLAVAVERKRLVVERVRCEEGDDLLWMLPGSVVVGTVRDRRRKAVGLVVRVGYQLRRGLRRVVRR